VLRYETSWCLSPSICTSFRTHFSFSLSVLVTLAPRESSPASSLPGPSKEYREYYYFRRFLYLYGIKPSLNHSKSTCHKSRPSFSERKKDTDPSRRMGSSTASRGLNTRKGRSVGLYPHEEEVTSFSETGSPTTENACSQMGIPTISVFSS